MIPSGPLAGKTIVVTRPRAQAAALAAAIEAAGGQALLFPLLEISPAADPAGLDRAVAELKNYRLAVFVSPNAVAYALPLILAAGPWPAGLTPAAVGPGTVKALAERGIDGCLVPARRFDSEGLLELPELAASRVAGQRVAIFRGDGGRELLAETLRQRGAQVDCLTCYRRSGPPLDSADLLDAEGRALLQHTPVFVPHARIAETARALGLDKIILTDAADTGIIAGLGAYNWSA